MLGAFLAEEENRVRMVDLPTLPSRLRPFSRWKPSTAASVEEPK